MNTIKGFFAGSGVGAFSDASVVERLLALVGNADKDKSVRVAYVGTATYDLPEPMLGQTSLLAAAGCEVRPVRLADPAVKALSPDDDAFIRKDADVVLVSGGNTLYAVRRWEETGMDKAMRAAAARQAVLAGGSAGAICWFTAGHSDSADPSTYAQAMIKAALGEPLGEDDTSTSWSYIRVHGLGILPGLVCPHYDKTQSNGVRREVDFSKMMKRHPTEHGIGIDHWAVLILDGQGHYEVFSTAGKSREPREGDSTTAASQSAATPTVFTLDVVEGALKAQEVPARSGRVEDLLKEPTGPVVADPFERFCAMQNPTPSSGALLRR